MIWRSSLHASDIAGVNFDVAERDDGRWSWRAMMPGKWVLCGSECDATSAQAVAIAAAEARRLAA